MSPNFSFNALSLSFAREEMHLEKVQGVTLKLHNERSLLNLKTLSECNVVYSLIEIFLKILFFYYPTVIFEA